MGRAATPITRLTRATRKAILPRDEISFHLMGIIRLVTGERSVPLSEWHAEHKNAIPSDQYSPWKVINDKRSHITDDSY